MNADSLLAQQPGRTLLEWRVHLARRQPARALVALVLVLVAAAAAGVIMGSPVFGLVVGLLLLGAIAEHLFPIYYCVSPEGVSARNLWSVRRMRWSQVRRCLRDDHGIKLSPLARPSRLEAYRGVYLWLDGNEEAVLSLIRHCRTASVGQELASCPNWPRGGA